MHCHTSTRLIHSDGHGLLQVSPNHDSSIHPVAYVKHGRKKGRVRLWGRMSLHPSLFREKKRFQSSMLRCDITSHLMTLGPRGSSEQVTGRPAPFSVINFLLWKSPHISKRRENGIVIPIDLSAEKKKAQTNS